MSWVATGEISNNWASKLMKDIFYILLITIVVEALKSEVNGS